MKSFAAEVTIGLALLLVFILVAAAPTRKSEFIELKHESGGVFIIRRDAIIGYSLPKSDQLKPQLLLHGGHSLNTAQRFTAEQFKEMMK